MPFTDARDRLRQLQAIKRAYDTLTNRSPILPSSQSVLPALLAGRMLERTIASSKIAVTTNQQDSKIAQNYLRREEVYAQDARLLTEALEERVERLRADQHNSSQQSATQQGREMIGKLQQRQQRWEAEAKRLRLALREFAEQYLGAMLAAEDLGGPIAGDNVELDDDALSAGFSSQGNHKKVAKRAASSKAKQQRIDVIWGNGGDRHTHPPSTEREAAATEFMGLMDDLLAASLPGAAPDGYVQLSRDSSAARFLVRAKVAQFHPKDAKRLRLFDFGRELDT
jgi:hypothetical protein